MQETETLQEKNQKNEEKEGERAGHAPLRGAERKRTLKEPGIKYISILLIQTQIVKSSCDPLNHMNSRVLGGGSEEGAATSGCGIQKTSLGNQPLNRVLKDGRDVNMQ